MRVPGFLLNQKCTIYPFLGYTPAGISYGTQYETKCRYELHRGKYTNSVGKQFISKAKLFLPYTTVNLALEMDTKIMINATEFNIESVTPWTGLNANSYSHIECILS